MNRDSKMESQTPTKNKIQTLFLASGIGIMTVGTTLSGVGTYESLFFKNKISIVDRCKDAKDVLWCTVEACSNTPAVQESVTGFLLIMVGGLTALRSFPKSEEKSNSYRP